jgi:hypothetical protein
MDIFHIVVLFDWLNRWNDVMWLITDFLPKPQVQIPHIPVHISYFLQNCKKGKPPKRDLPLMENDITGSELTFKTTDT